MIGVVLQLLPLFVYSVWMIRRATQTRQARASNPRAVRVVAATGLEDDPAHWPVIRGSWTALDERQLVRLLTDSAP